MNRQEFLRMMKGFEETHPSGPTIDGLLKHIAKVAEKAPHGGAIYAAHTYVQGPARSEVLVVPQSGWKFRDPKSINGMRAHLMYIAGSQRSLKSNLMKWVAYNYGVWDMTSQIIVLAPKRPEPEPSAPAKTQTRRKRKLKTSARWQSDPWPRPGDVIDEGRKAKLPGRRVSASGKVYYERRRNRSDMPWKKV